MKSKWTAKKVEKLGKYVNSNKMSFKKAGKKLGFSASACSRKYDRIDWDDLETDSLPPEPWTKVDMSNLHQFKVVSGLTYRAISKKIKRSVSQVESKFQHTDWEDFFKRNEENRKGVNIKESNNSINSEELTEEAEAELLEEKKHQLASYVVELSRHNLPRLETITEKYFLNKTNLKRSDLPIPFREIKEKAGIIMHQYGLGYEESVVLGPGNYIVVGDSHGKHTKRSMFNLLEQVNKTIKPDKIIHIGHALDDDNDFSYLWGELDNLVILSKREELQALSKNNRKRLSEGKSEISIVRDEISLGDITVANQDLITDYVETFIGSIKSQVFPGNVITNLHRQELDSRTVSVGHSIILSPGCLCEKHIVKTIKQVDFTDGKQIKMSYPDSFTKYRRMRHKYHFWEQGLVVVHVDQFGKAFPIQCRIKKTSKGYTTSYLGTIIHEKGTSKPDKKHIMSTDAHVPLHDSGSMDIQRQIAEWYKPDQCVNLGDVMRNQALNHHNMARNGSHIDTATFEESIDMMDEAAHVHWVLKKQAEWAKEFVLLYGNHERFTKDFVDKYPQLRSLMDFSFTGGLDDIGLTLVPLKNVHEDGPVRFLHGDIRMYGAKGPMMDKVAHTFGQSSVVGHLHAPCIRLGCYMIGLSGLFDQAYNEPNASKWMHGCGVCDTFEDQAFISVIHIRDHSTAILDREFVPETPELWDLPKYSSAISYQFD